MDQPQASTSTICHLTADGTPGHIHAHKLTKESAEKVSELLNVNHATYHTRWKGTFHNHIVHHLIGLWALGASPEEVQDLWEFNIPYQTSLNKVLATGNDIAALPLDLRIPAVFAQSLGKDECYADFLKFFEDEIAEKGMQNVVKEYLLKGDARANDIFYRMYTDLVHPIIHLGCGLEFNQPALVAEALAAACVHDNWPKQFLQPTEEHVRSRTNSTDSTKSHLQLLEGLRNDPLITSGVKDTDPFNKIPDGLLQRVGPEHLVPHLSQFRVRADPHDLQQKTRDMMRSCVYVLGAAQRPGKQERFDFVFLHTVTLAVFYPAIIALDWLSDAEKARMVEAKARVDAVMYAGCRCPELFPDRIREYRPQRPADGWAELIHRSVMYRDEGHVVKAMRAIYGLNQMRLDCEVADGGDDDAVPIAQEGYLKIAHMLVDSVEKALQPGGNNVPRFVSEAVEKQVGTGGEMVTDNMKRFVFYGGLPKAWDFVPDLEKLSPATSA